jgi:quercetin dioxygenase-like cupin family protein
MELKVMPWTGEDEPTEEHLRETLEQPDATIFRWSNQPEDVYPAHTHGYHKIVFVLEGSIKFDFPVRHKTLNLNPGDRLELPAGIRHSAVVGPEGVTCLETHVY